MIDFVRVKQSRYFPGCMGPNPLLHVIQSCAGGRSKGEISAFVDSIAPEVSAGRVFPLSAAPRRGSWCPPSCGRSTDPNRQRGP